MLAPCCVSVVRGHCGSRCERLVGGKAGSEVFDAVNSQCERLIGEKAGMELFDAVKLRFVGLEASWGMWACHSTCTGAA